MCEKMRLEKKRKGKAPAKPKKRQRLIPRDPKGMAIKEPTQVPFSQQDSTFESNDEEQGKDEVWEGPSSEDSNYKPESIPPDSSTSLVNSEDADESTVFERVRVHLTEEVMKTVSSFRNLSQRKEYDARTKKKFISGREVDYEALDELEVRAEFEDHLHVGVSSRSYGPIT